MSIFSLADKSPTEQIAAIENGLPGSTLRQIVEVLPLSQKAVIQALRFAPRTVAQRASRREPFSAAESERLLRVVRLRKLAREVFSTDDAVAQWMTTADAALGDRTPLEMLATDLGASRVENLVRAMIHGVPV